MAVARWSRFFPLVPNLGGAVALLMLALSMLSSNLDFDEAYNLQTVDSLVGLKTFASYGALEGTGPWAFDPHVTTGLPAAVPVAVGWWLTGGSLLSVRVVMLGWLLVYLWGCIKLCGLHRRGTPHRIPEMLACAPVLIVGFSDLGRFLGELPASTLVILSLVALGKDRFALSGCLAALALLVKFVLVVFLPVLLVTVVVLRRGSRGRNASLVAGAATGTIALHELYRFAVVGSWREYRISLTDLRSFMISQQRPSGIDWFERDILTARWESLLSMVTVGCLVLFAAVLLLTASSRATGGYWKRRDRCELLLPALAVGPLLLGGWVVGSMSGDARQVLPVFLVSGPALMIFLSLGMNRQSLRVLSFVAVGCVIYSTISESRFDLDPLDDQQRSLQSELMKMGVQALFSNGWYQNPELQLLLGVPAVPWPVSKQVMVLGASGVVAPGVNASFSAEEVCGERFRVGEVELCHVRDDLGGTSFRPEVVNWGEQSAVRGNVPNRQVDGQAGFWAVVKPRPRAELASIRFRINGDYLKRTVISESGEVLTALAPSTFFADVGELVVELEDLATGQVTQLGSAQVVDQ